MIHQLHLYPTLCLLFTCCLLPASDIRPEGFVVTGGWEPKGVWLQIPKRKALSAFQRAVFSGDLNKVLSIRVEKNDALISQIQTKCGLSVLDLAILSENTDMLRLLLNLGLAAQTPNERGFYPIHTACQQGNFEAVELLLRSGADLESIESDGQYTPLSLSIRMHHSDLARYLIANGADIHHRRNHNLTPLHEAACSGDLELCRLLLDLGVDIDAFSLYESTPLYYAICSDQYEISQLLLEYGAKVELPDSANLLTIRWLAENIAKTKGDRRYLDLIEIFGSKKTESL